MTNTIEILALIGLSIVCVIIIIIVSVVCIKRERDSKFKSNDPTMFYPNDSLYGAGWQKGVTPEQMKAITTAYTQSLAVYNAGAE